MIVKVAQTMYHECVILGAYKNIFLKSFTIDRNFMLVFKSTSKKGSSFWQVGKLNEWWRNTPNDVLYIEAKMDVIIQKSFNLLNSSLKKE